MSLTLNRRLIGLFCLYLSSMGMLSSVQAADNVQIQVKLIPVIQGTLQATRRYTGQITPISSAVHVTACAFEGQVTRLYVQAGSAIVKGTPLMTVRTSTRVQQQVAQTQANLNYANQHLTQVRVMLKAHLATQGDLAQAEQGLALARADWQSLVSSGATTPDHTIKASHNGFVQQINVQLGGVFAANQPLLTSVDAGQLEVKVPVPVAVANQLAMGDSAQIQPAFGDAQAMSTRIAAIDPMVLPNSNRQPIHMQLPKWQQAKWVMGQAVTAYFTLPGQTGFILPHAAIQTDGHGQTIVWLDRNHMAQSVPVRVLDTVEAQSVIQPTEAGTLKAGDRVVAVGAPNVAAGMKLIAETTP